MMVNLVSGDLFKNRKRKGQKKGQVECKIDKRCGQGTVARHSLALLKWQFRFRPGRLAFNARLFGQMFVASSLPSARIWLLAKTLQ
jgi:hypothetical protein